MNINEEQNRLLLKYGIDYKLFNGIDELLDSVDDKLLEHLVDQDYLDDEGIILQKLYDEIFDNN